MRTMTVTLMIGLNNSSDWTVKFLKSKDSSIILLDLSDSKYHEDTDDSSDFEYRFTALSRALIALDAQINTRSTTENINVIINNGMFVTNQDVLRVISTLSEKYTNFNILVNVDYWPEMDCSFIDDAINNIERDKSYYSLAKMFKTFGPETLKAQSVNLIHKHSNLLGKYIMPNCREGINRIIIDKDTVIYIEKDFTIRSKYWCAGGTEYDYDYYDSEFDTYVESEQPVEFTELNNFLNYFYPSLTFKHYITAYHNSVTCNTTDSSVSQYYWSCDLRKLILTLEELGYKNPFNFNHLYV